MRAWSIAIGVLFAGVAVDGEVVEDFGYRMGELCVSNQGSGLGDVVGGFRTSYPGGSLVGGTEKKQWMFAVASMKRIVTNVAHSGTQGLFFQAPAGDSGISHLRSPTLLYPAGETGAFTSNSDGVVRSAVSSNYIFSMWIRTVAGSSNEARAAGRSLVTTSADDARGQRIGGNLFLDDNGGTNCAAVGTDPASGGGIGFRLRWNQSFFSPYMNPYNWGYDTDAMPSPNNFTTTGNPEGRSGLTKHVRGLESASVWGPLMDYGRWYKIEYRIDFVDGNNNGGNFSHPAMPSVDKQNYAATNTLGIAESNSFESLGAPSRYPNDVVTISVWDDRTNLVFQWGRNTVMVCDPPHLNPYPGGTSAYYRTYVGLFTQEARGFGWGGANCQQFRCPPAAAGGPAIYNANVNGRGFYLDDILVSSGNGCYNYFTSFERHPLHSGVMLMFR